METLNMLTAWVSFFASVLGLISGVLAIFLLVTPRDRVIEKFQSYLKKIIEVSPQLVILVGMSVFYFSNKVCGLVFLGLGLTGVVILFLTKSREISRIEIFSLIFNTFQFLIFITFYFLLRILDVIEKVS